jgi:hypothetical protein
VISGFKRFYFKCNLYRYNTDEAPPASVVMMGGIGNWLKQEKKAAAKVKAGAGADAVSPTPQLQFRGDVSGTGLPANRDDSHDGASGGSGGDHPKPRRGRPPGVGGGRIGRPPGSGRGKTPGGGPRGKGGRGAGAVVGGGCTS